MVIFILPGMLLLKFSPFWIVINQAMSNMYIGKIFVWVMDCYWEEETLQVTKCFLKVMDCSTLFKNICCFGGVIFILQG